MNPEIIDKYFPRISPRQKEQFGMLYELYGHWNEKINVVSRKDIENLYERHVLHSLAIASFLGDLAEDTKFVDVGTGGGFPGIPLAIVYPEARFHLVDRIGKKIMVAGEIAKSLGLENVTFLHGDMGECHEKFDYAVSRAAMNLQLLCKIVRKNISPVNRNKYKNGLVCLKGGDLEEESKGIAYPVLEYPLREYFNEDFFDTKKLVYVPMA